MLFYTNFIILVYPTTVRLAPATTWERTTSTTKSSIPKTMAYHNPDPDGIVWASEKALSKMVLKIQHHLHFQNQYDHWHENLFWTTYAERTHLFIFHRTTEK